MKILLVVLFVLGAVNAVVEEEQACFDGTSYIRYDASSKPMTQSKDKITFKFRSVDASGLLMYAHSRGLNGDYILLELNRGKLSVHYQLGRNSTLKESILGDGLGDDIVSSVVVDRNKKELTLSANGGQSDKLILRIPGTDDRVDINGNIYIGGIPSIPQQYPSIQKVNFRGCMFKATFDKIDFINGVKYNREGFFEKHVKITSNPRIPPRSMNFNRETFIKFIIQEGDPNDKTTILKELYGSLEFRTVLHEGTIFQTSSVSLKFSRSQLSLHSGSDIVAIDFPDEGQANDGRWFQVEYMAKNEEMMLKLNDVKNVIIPRNNPQFGADIYFGFYKNEHRFIGCIRSLSVLNRSISYAEIIDPYRTVKLADAYSELTEGCKASDPCIPNPCFHEAECLTVVTDPGVDCDCQQNYKEPLCQFSNLATSCSAKKKFFPGTVTQQRQKFPIDPDDSGPLPPVNVQCDYNKNAEGLTEIETIGAQEVSIDTAKHSERFSYKKDIIYDVPIESVKAIVDRSEYCSQKVKYDCRDAKLFNAPGGDPSSRWLSANGYLQYYWGGAEPNSYKCACAYRPRGCLENAFCNCDSKLAETQAQLDEGQLNVTRDLPIRQVQFGLFSRTSQAIYTIERVACYGIDTLGVVTFVAPDGWIRGPPWDAPYGGDISFYIKTVFAKGDLIDHRNYDESHLFQVRIHNETTIEVTFSFGSSIRTNYRGAINGPDKLNDNEWHRIHVIRTLWELKVRIDDKPAVDPVSKQVLPPYHLTGDGRSRLNIDLPLFIGASWRYPAYKDGFVGCMKGFTINGVLFDLANAVDNLALEPEVLVLKGCGSACEHKPCPFGACVDKYTSFECDCSDTPFYGTYCSKEIGTRIDNSPVYANLTMPLSKTEKMVLAFSTEAGGPCSGTLFEVLSEDEKQYYKLTLKGRTSLHFVFKLLSRLPEVTLTINVKNMDFCDTTRHIVYLERYHYLDSSFFRYSIDGRREVIKEYKEQAEVDFIKPYNYYVGNTKAEDDPFDGCISGAKFHLFNDQMMKTIEPIAVGVRSNDSNSQIEHQACGPTINTPLLMTTRAIPEPTTPTDYPSTEFLRDFGIHEAEDTNWAVLIVVALLLMLVLVAVVVLTIWFVMQHKNDYQILEKADGTVVGTATVRGGASVASVPVAGSAYIAPVRAPPSQSSQGNLSRAKSKSNDLFV